MTITTKLQGALVVFFEGLFPWTTKIAVGFNDVEGCCEGTTVVTVGIIVGCGVIIFVGFYVGCWLESLQLYPKAT